MEIIKRKDGNRYREMIYVDGKLLKSPSFRRKTDARTWKDRMRYEASHLLASGLKSKIDQKITVSELCEKWLKDSVSIQCTKRTVSEYKNKLEKHILPVIGHVKLQSLDLEHGEEILRCLKTAGKNNHKGINQILGVIKTAVAYAKKQRLISTNPFEELKPLPEEPSPAEFWVPSEATQFLRANVKDPLYGFYFAALYTGMRRGELAGLCWDRVDFVGNQITVSRTRDKNGLRETTKTRQIRSIPLHPELKGILQSLWRRGLGTSPYVFLTPNGEPISVHHVYRDFAKAQKKAGVKKIRFHDLRHSFASIFMMNGGSLFDLQKILGHTLFDMTLRYAHHSPAHLLQALDYMGPGSGAKGMSYPDSNHTKNESLELRIVE